MSELTPLGITPEQQANLEKLATHLEGLPADYGHFGMSAYFVPSDSGSVMPFQVEEHNCGSVACAIGHGPSAGIPANKDEVFWGDYALRVFGTEDGEPGLGQYLFSGRWRLVDNTSSGAAARIRFVIQTGVPDDWYTQMEGTAPLSYKATAA